MATARIEFTVEVPEGASRREVAEWAQYHLGWLATLGARNPMLNTPLEPANAPCVVEWIRGRAS